MDTLALHPLPLHLGAHTTTSGLDLSGVAVHGDAMFLATDEGADLLRLRRGTGPDGGWGSPVALPLVDALDLPGDPGDEVDAEGLDVAGGCLWVAGSHSPKRRRVKDGTPPEDVGRRLAGVSPERSRRLLARLPLVDGPDGPVPAARGRVVPGLGGSARLPAGRRGLMGVLAEDEHLAPFLGIPGKDNGFDVEGIALVPGVGGRGGSGDARVLLGLRGPVLRGWAVVLGLDVRLDGTELALDAVTKHFLDLDGLGVRDLAREGDDLLVLAGPTMVLDGPARVLRLPGGSRGALPPAVHRDEVEVVTELAVGVRCDRPEGLAVLEEGLLVLHDTPAGHRVADGALTADLLVGPARRAGGSASTP